jgi:hypothetical protein
MQHPDLDGCLVVVQARVGVGKSAFLVQVALEAMLRGRPVLHLSLEGQVLEHLESWYDALLLDLLSPGIPIEEMAALRRLRVIHAISSGVLDERGLERVLGDLRRHLDFVPRLILVDGLDWSRPAPALRAELGALIRPAAESGAGGWMPAPRHNAPTEPRKTRLPPPLDGVAELVGAVVSLEPEGNAVGAQLLFGQRRDSPLSAVRLHPDTLRRLDGEPEAEVSLPSSAFCLLSGGAPGAEAVFGECAEAFGVEEINFSFAGHDCQRARGRVILSESELRQGDISWTYLTRRMQRSYPESPELRRVLQSIWHQVHTAAEVFVIGQVQADGTVRGGTGWAAELARHWKKPLWVFDQAQDAWREWSEQGWRSVPPPRISRTRFAGTGTRHLEENGRRAIRELFERSFSDRGR